jgi:hypothetical protein
MNFGQSYSFACFQFITKTILIILYKLKLFIKIILKDINKILLNLILFLKIIFNKFKILLKISLKLLIKILLKINLKLEKIKFIVININLILIKINLKKLISLIISLILIYVSYIRLFLIIKKIFNFNYINLLKFIEIDLDFINFLNLIKDYLYFNSLLLFILTLIILFFFNIYIPMKFYLSKIKNYYHDNNYINNCNSNILNKNINNDNLKNIILNWLKILKFILPLILNISTIDLENFKFLFSFNNYLNFFNNDNNSNNVIINSNDNQVNINEDNNNRSRSNSLSSNSSDNSNCSDSSNLSSKSFLKKEIKFLDYKDLSQEDKIDFLKQKFYLKGLDYNPYLLNYLSDTLLKNTNGSNLDVNNYLNKDLNILSKNLIEARLNNHGFFRVKPFLIHKKYDLSYPNVIPYKNKITDYEINNM